MTNKLKRRARALQASAGMSHQAAIQVLRRRQLAVTDLDPDRDGEGVVQLWNATSETPVDRETLDTIEREHPGERKRFVLLESRKVVALCALVRRREEPKGGFWISVRVHPEARRRGLGARVLRHALSWARAEGVAGLVGTAAATNEAALRLSARCGFSIDRLLALQRALQDEQPTPKRSDWMLRPLHALDDAELRAAWRLHRLAARDLSARSGWCTWARNQARWREEIAEVSRLSRVAMHADDVVGLAMVSADEQARTIQLDLTVVKPFLRRRGIARALKQAIFADAFDAGFRIVRACNREGSHAHAMNVGLGFEVVGSVMELRWRARP